jgi:ATP-dependent protease ClpP protease subunit
MAMAKNTEELTVNWNRCIYVDTVINDEFVRSATARIFSLRQESNLPITVAINSPGGSLAAVETLLGLITGPNQDNVTCQAITVSVHHAYSAAANLLASGHYAVALPHSEILFHDVRYGGMQDVTPAVARIAASQLQDANEEFALKLANRVFRRLVWNYIDLRDKFDEINLKFPTVYAKYSTAIAVCADPTSTANVDISSFATALFARVTRQSESLIEKAMEQLNRWGLMTGIAKSIPAYRTKGTKSPGLLDGSRHLFQLMGKAIDYKDDSSVWEKIEPDFKIFLTLISENAAKEKPLTRLTFSDILESATEDFKLIGSINDPKHFRTATTQLLRHKHIFFSPKALADLDSGDEILRETALREAMPTAKLFCHFCVLLCRELFNGEHIITPHDAQVLGLIDEVAGGGLIESKREFRVNSNKKEEDEKPN